MIINLLLICFKQKNIISLTILTLKNQKKSELNNGAKNFVKLLLIYNGKKIEMLDANGGKVVGYDWLVQWQLLLIGNGSSVSVLTGEEKVVEVQWPQPAMKQGNLASIPPWPCGKHW